VDHLKLVGRNRGVVESIQDVLPQPGQGPAAELAIDRGPLAELFEQVPPRRPSPSDPENSIKNKTMIGCFALVRMPDCPDEALQEAHSSSDIRLRAKFISHV